MNSKTKEYFGLGDMFVFAGSLFISLIVGLYFAIKDRKENTIANYFFGGKQLSPVMLGLSLSVSYISAITVIAYPTESYWYGTVCFWYAVPCLVSTAITCAYYIPLIHRLQLNTLYQYLEMRFHPSFRKLVSGCEIFSLLIYMSFTLYIPALALSAVSPINIYWSILLTSGVCTLYTTLGGLKAVVWTDVIQFGIILCGVLSALIKATIDVGGLGNVWSALQQGGRTNFLEFDPDPTIRTTFWTIMIGTSVNSILNACINQPVCQRYLSCKSVKDARISGLNYITAFATYVNSAAAASLFPKIAVSLIATSSGCVAYAYFKGCDPLEAGFITKNDQMFPYLVMKVFREVPGMAGLFVAAAYSGTMSTVSSGLNSASVQLLQDFFIPLQPNLSSNAKICFSKLAVFFMGLVVTGIAFLSTLFDGTVVSILTTIKGALAGTILGVYTLGIIFPWCNTKGAFVGQIVGTAVSLWIAVGGLVYGKSPESQRKLPVTVDKCSVAPDKYDWENITTINSPTLDYWNTTSTFDNEERYSPLYALSFWYYALLAVIITVVFGLSVSFLTGPNNPAESDPRLFCPIIDNRRLPERVRRFFRFGVPEIHSVELKRNVKRQMELTLEEISSKKNEENAAASLLSTTK